MPSRPASYSLLAVGELLWDHLPSGKVLGGAPANVAVHAQALGVASGLVSCVGADSEGEEILSALARLGLPQDFIRVSCSLKTGAAMVQLDQQNQVHFAIAPNSAWDAIGLNKVTRDAAARADAIYFGTLAQRSAVSRIAIEHLLSLAPKSAIRFFDANLRTPFFSKEIVKSSLERANVLKLNESELGLFADWFGLGGPQSVQISGLARMFTLDVIALTRGEHGSLIVAGGEECEHPGLRVEVRDTVGAGDAFSSVLIVGLLNGWPIPRISRLASEVSAFVCSQDGATPKLAPALLAACGQ